VSIPKALLDTDTISQVMRGNSKALRQSEKYFETHGRFTFSAISAYEILRGVRLKRSVKLKAIFRSFSQKSELLKVTEAIAEQAADIYADLHQRGEPLPDADIIIAATALVHDLPIVTNNEKDFSRIRGLSVENWLK
jgi:tRNA(fMet)-specific endonuclease VapC